MVDVAIVGGGLAGCSAAIQLAAAGHKVLLLEKKTYPVHKLCGEFLSPEVKGALQRLGVLRDVEDAGAHAMHRTRITASNGAVFEAPLPGKAIGFSRYRLDPMLFARAAACGADVRDGTMVRSVEGNLRDGFTLGTRNETFEARVVLGAYGKRGVLDRTLNREALQQHRPYVGFKAHFRGVDLEDVIELHAFDGGYCGMSHVEDELVNACWITHEDTLKAADRSPEGMIEQTFQTNPHLRDRFEHLERVSDSFCAVSQVSVRPKTAFEGDVCMIGDTAGMIAPMCGDGMAMALRSAELVAPHVDSFLQDASTADAFRSGYTADWHAEFGTRMRVGRWAHQAYIRPWVASAGLALCQVAPFLARWVIRNTRG